MDFETLGIVGVAAITIICYLVGLIVKATPWNNNQLIPIVCGVVGLALGLVCYFTGLEVLFRRPGSAARRRPCHRRCGGGGVWPGAAAYPHPDCTGQG